MGWIVRVECVSRTLPFPMHCGIHGESPTTREMIPDIYINLYMAVLEYELHEIQTLAVLFLVWFSWLSAPHKWFPSPLSCWALRWWSWVYAWSQSLMTQFLLNIFKSICHFNWSHASCSSIQRTWESHVVVQLPWGKGGVCLFCTNAPFREWHPPPSLLGSVCPCWQEMLVWKKQASFFCLFLVLFLRLKFLLGIFVPLSEAAISVFLVSGEWRSSWCLFSRGYHVVMFPSVPNATCASLTEAWFCVLGAQMSNVQEQE